MNAYNLIPVLAAPTASGKTALALELAKRFPLEIISADAMMVYKDMDIGTAKPSDKEQKAVAHHLIDVVSPAERFSVTDYVRLAETAIADVLARGSIPFVVGGTGFYIRALAEGLPTVPEVDEGVQAPLWLRYEKEGIEGLHKELEAFSLLDAERAQRNPRRVIRALEIIERTGKPASSFPKTKPAFKYKKVILLPDKELLKKRIVLRTEEMFRAGLVNEVKELLQTYPKLATARQAIGYKEVIAYLEGLQTLEEAKNAITLATLQYAKRQRTWFRKEKDATFFYALAEDVYDELAQELENDLYNTEN